MASIINMHGQRFGRLVVLSHLGRQERRGRTHYWLCRCDCGVEKPVCGGDLRSGDTVSCGCHSRELARAAGDRTRTHGLSSESIHNIWDSMIQRCTNRKRKDFPRYGGRGITVCARWLSFENFYADMGDRPSRAHSLDRVDLDLGYAPANCRWATATQQARNHSGNLRIEIRGVTRCFAEWCELLGMNKQTVTQRRARGWPIEEALLTPPDRRFAHAQLRILFV